MVKINLCGGLFGSSGYAVHVRRLFNSLVEAGAEVRLETNLVPAWEGLVNDQELRAIKTPHFKDGVTIMVNIPPFWPLGQQALCKKFYGYVVWEGTRVPECWLAPMLAADGILVPSQHVKTAIWNTFPDQSKLMEKVHIVPHGVDTSLFVPQPTPEIFTFVANKGFAQGMMDRGGLQFLFKAFHEEFSPEEPVMLRVKINTAYNPPGWELGVELKKLGIPEGRSQLMICTDEIAYKAMPAIYQGHCFVSPTMGEAFNIPCLEAMSCGLPVITTGFGGQTDFVTDENGWLLDYDLFEIEHDVMYEGNEWAMPRLDHLKRLLRFAYENRDLCKEKGLKAQTIASEYRWHNTAITILQLLEDGDTPYDRNH